MNLQKRLEFKQNLKQRHKVFAGWTSFGHPQITEILSHCGIDFMGIDIEHSTINQAELQRIIAACHAKGVYCLPRVATHNQEAIKRLLDSGADGVIVPTVEIPAQVEQLIEWIKYPPLGKRGYGISRAQSYGYDLDDYYATWNESSVLVIQIESILGVENIESLLEFDDVDGVMLGPYDLAGSLGVPGEVDHEEVRKASKHVVEACKKFKKACGPHLVDPTKETINKAIELGYTFIVLGSDVFILWKWGERMKKLIQESR
tara:strand:+ start:980 stop:1759 length:780 start_codon:yes stop_codon:yes gene_type:complete